MKKIYVIIKTKYIISNEKMVFVLLNKDSANDTFTSLDMAKKEIERRLLKDGDSEFTILTNYTKK